MAKGSIDVTQAVAEFIEKKGDQAVRVLYEDNYDLRRKNRQLTKKLEEAENAGPKEDQILKEGQVAVSKEDASLLAGYKELGKLDDLKSAISERDELKEKNQAREHESLVRRIGSIAGWNPDVLVTIGSDLDYEISGSGDKQEVRVKTKSEKGEEEKVLLTDYAKEHWGHMMAALETEAGTRTVLSQQSASGASVKKEPTKDEHLKEQETRVPALSI